MLLWLTFRAFDVAALGALEPIHTILACPAAVFNLTTLGVVACRTAKAVLILVPSVAFDVDCAAAECLLATTALADRHRFVARARRRITTFRAGKVVVPPTAGSFPVFSAFTGGVAAGEAFQRVGAPATRACLEPFRCTCDSVVVV